MADTTQPAGALPELVTETAPERIWLVIGADCPADARFDSLEEVTWCQDKIDDNSIEYVHADVAHALRADRESWRDKAHRTDLLAEKLMAERDAAREEAEEHRQARQTTVQQNRNLREENDALRRELEELRAIPPDAREGREPQWRPIATAPKDMASYMFLCSGVAMQGFRDATGELCVCQEEGTKRWRSMRRKPTHWMPLPIGPAGTSADGAQP